MVLQVNRLSKGDAFDQLRYRLKADARHHQDIYVKGRDIEFNPEALITIRNAVNENGKEVRAPGPYSWNDYAFSQFCSDIEVPPVFIRRCPTQGPSSKKAILDYWKNSYANGKSFLLRLNMLERQDEKTGARGYVRACLTSRFSKFDNLELLDVVEPFVRERGLAVQIGTYTDKSFHLRLLDPRKIDVGGDVHQVGVHLRNSEVGMYNLSGDFMLYRQVCTNGLVVMFDRKSLFTHKHIGIEAHEIRTSLAASLDKLKDRTDSVVTKLEESILSNVSQPLQEIRRQLRMARVTEEFVVQALTAYEEEPNPSRFGIIQAITRAAQKLTSVDQRLEMEQTAGHILMAA